MHPNREIKPISIGASGSRIRLSARLIKSLNWDSALEDFECYGFFRHPGELIIAPKWLESPDSNHPFEELLEYVNPTIATQYTDLKEIPPTHILTSANRIVEFPATWIADRKQLDLKVGSSISSRLGWKKAENSNVYPTIWSQMLILLSEKRFFDSQEHELKI